MSIRWDALDERQRKIKEEQKALKEFLKQQNEQDKLRKQQEKKNEIETFRKITQVEAPRIPMKSHFPPPPESKPETIRLALPEPTMSVLPSSTVLPSLSSLPSFPSISQLNSQPIVDPETLTKLRLTEDALQQEKRARQWVESELQSTKTLLLSLTARVDKLTEKATLDEQHIRDLSKGLQQSEQNVKELGNQLALKADKDALKLQSVVNELVAKQRASDSLRQEQETQSRVLAEQLNHLRYKLEGYVMKTEQVGSELDSKAREWSTESQKSNDALRAVKSHDQALQSLHNVMDSTADQLSRKFEQAHFEIKQRFESELRARQQFETNMRELTGEWRKVVSNQERELVERIESMRQGVQMQIQFEADQRVQLANALTEEQRNFHKEVKESQMEVMERMGQEFKSVSEAISEDRATMRQIEQRLSTTIDEGLAMVQQGWSKKIAEASDRAAEAKRSIGQVAKALQDSIMIAEKTATAKLKTLEDVLRAEIKSRMDTDTTMKSLAGEVKTNLEMLEKRSESRVQDALEQHQADVTTLAEQIKQLSDKISSANDRSTALIEVDIERLSKAIKQQESHNANLLAQVKLDNTKSLEEMTLQMNQHREQVSKDFEDHVQSTLVLSNQVKEMELTFTTFSTEVEEKFNLKAMQLDSTMEVLKQELVLCAKTTDLTRNQEQVELVESKLYDLEKATNDQMDGLKADLLQRISKEEMQGTVLELKSDHADLKQAVAEIDGKVIKSREEIQSKADIKVLEDLQEQVKQNLQQVKTQVHQIQNDIDGCKQKMEKLATKRELTEKASAIEESLQETDERADELQNLMTTMKEGLEKMISTEAVSALDQRYKEQIDGINDTLNAIQTTVVDLRNNVESEQHKHALQDQLEEQEATLAKVSKDVKKLREDTNKKHQEILESLTKRITESVSPLEANQAKQLSMTNNLQVELIDRSRLFNEKVQELFAALDQVSDGRDEIREELDNQIQDLKSQLDRMEDQVNEKASMAEVQLEQQHLQSDIQRMQGKMEVELLNLEQVKTRVQELDENYKTKFQSLIQQQDRNIRENTSSLKHLKENLNRKLDDLESRMRLLPSQTELVAQDLKDVRKDLSYLTQATVSRIEAEIAVLKSDMKHCITERELDASIANAVTPVQSRLDQLYDNRRTTPDRETNSGNFFKPAFTDRKKTPKTEDEDGVPKVPLKHTPSSKEF